MQDRLLVVLQLVSGVCKNSALYSHLLSVPELGAVTSCASFVVEAPCRGKRGEAGARHPASS